MNTNIFPRAAVALGVALVAVAPAAAQPAATWGVTMATTESGEAQRRFVEGVTAMHLHMYEDAEEHFLAAQKLAPDFVMAYWGEALNQHRTIWSYHNRDKALAALAKLGPTPEARAAKAPTTRERGYLAAVEALFGAGTQRERELAYAVKMQALSAANPDDLEALAWYCLSLMRVDLPGLTRQQTRMEMASLALKVLQKNAKHPGANRYLIQSTDDPTHSPIGWIAVDNLKAVKATGAEVIHVPSHVYLQHGMWQEVAEANRAAFDASMAWVDAHGWKLADLNLHNYGHLLNFLNYAYLESGQLQKAAEVRDRIRKDFFASGKAAEIRRWFVDVYARCIVELAEWDEVTELAASMREEKLNDTPIWLAIGIGAARTNQLALAREALANMPKDANGLESLPARELRGLIALATRAEGRGAEGAGAGRRDRSTGDRPHRHTAKPGQARQRALRRSARRDGPRQGRARAVRDEPDPDAPAAVVAAGRRTSEPAPRPRREGRRVLSGAARRLEDRRRRSPLCCRGTTGDE